MDPNKADGLMTLDARKARRLLDDGENIRKVDKHGMLRFIGALPDEMASLLKRPAPHVRDLKGHTNVVFSGMGGSGIGGDIIRSWLGPKAGIPFFVNRGYDIPPFVGPGTLFLAISFSGNTAETLSSFEKALDKGCTVVALSSGGKLEEKARAAGVPFHMVEAPEGTAPRAALGHMLVPLALFLEGAGLVEARGELEEAVHVLKDLRGRLGPEVPWKVNESKRVAAALHGLIPVMHGYGLLEVAARRWKTQFNENAKVLAWADYLPEMDHNSLVGWNGDRASRGHASVMLRDAKSEQEDPRMADRVEATKELAWSNSARLVEVLSEGNGPLARIISAIYKGDYASVYLAVLRKVDPLPVEAIEALKDRLDKGHAAKGKGPKKG
jgi:glucose/mannose-6-phosphate isomerase